MFLFHVLEILEFFFVDWVDDFVVAFWTLDCSELKVFFYADDWLHFFVAVFA